MKVLIPIAGGDRHKSIGSRALRGLVLMLAQNVFTRACSFLSQLALAAILRPGDFGEIGLTYTVTSIALTLTSIGIDDIALQRQRGLRLWTGVTFWMSFVSALTAAVLVVLISPLAARVYGVPDLVGLLAVLALSMPISALSTVPGMVMRSRLQFGVVALSGSVEMVAVIVMTIGLALAGFGPYSFAIPTPVVTLGRTIVWWWLTGTQMSFRPQWHRWKYVVGNVGVNFLTRTVTSLIGQGDYAILGLVSGPDVVGIYYFAFRLAAQPLWMLAGNFSGVLFPALVQMAAEPLRQRDAVLKASKLLSFCIMPVALMQAAVADPVVTGYFGEKWHRSIPVMQLLSVGLAFDAISWVAGAFLNARREFSALLRYVLVMAPLFFLLVTIGASIDAAVGAAAGVCVYYMISQPVFVFVVYRRVGVDLPHVAALYAAPTALAILAVGLGVAAAHLTIFHEYPTTRIIIILAISASMYAALIRVSAPTVWRELAGRAGNVIPWPRRIQRSSP